jgi:hypothetical protein
MNVKDRRFPERGNRKAWPSKPRNCKACAELDPPLDSYYCRHFVARRQLVARDYAAPDDTETFDLVVATLPLGVMEDVLVREQDAGVVSVATSHAAWQSCFSHVRHTESQALRIWFRVPLKPAGSRSLGWTQQPPILSGYLWPFNTWEDNSQATHIHDFPEDQPPRTIATVFGPLETGELSIRDLSHLQSQTEIAKRSALNFVHSDMLPLWPGLKNDSAPGQVDWASFIDLNNAEGPDRFHWQHVIANVGPIESYVQAAPNTLQHRLRADESQFSNLLLAGDWTRNGIEVGSVEGAVISGLKAAKAIVGDSIRIVGGDDFDRGTLFVNDT